MASSTSAVAAVVVAAVVVVPAAVDAVLAQAGRRHVEHNLLGGRHM